MFVKTVLKFNVKNKKTTYSSSKVQTFWPVGSIWGCEKAQINSKLSTKNNKAKEENKSCEDWSILAI